MFYYFLKSTDNSEAVSDKHICLNNLGYFADLSEMTVCREKGRVDFQLIYVKEGEIAVHDNGKEITLGAGSVCLYRPSEAQIYGVNKKLTTFFWIHFSGYAVKNMLSFFMKRSYFVGELPEFERYCKGFSDVGGAGKEYIELLYEGELIALIARIARRIVCNEKRQDEMFKIRPALNAMRLQSTERKTNEYLAELCGISKCYFEKIFKNVMNISPQQYYAELVLDKGCYLLTSTTYNVTEVARLCGIDDGLYFSRFFKKHKGMSPLTYRKKFSK